MPRQERCFFQRSNNRYWISTKRISRCQKNPLHCNDFTTSGFRIFHKTKMINDFSNKNYIFGNKTLGFYLLNGLIQVCSGVACVCVSVRVCQFIHSHQPIAIALFSKIHGNKLLYRFISQLAIACDAWSKPLLPEERSKLQNANVLLLF